MPVPIADRDLLLLKAFHMTVREPQWTNFRYATIVWLNIPSPLTDDTTERQFAAATADPKWKSIKAAKNWMLKIQSEKAPRF